MKFFFSNERISNFLHAAIAACLMLTAFVTAIQFAHKLV